MNAVAHEPQPTMTPGRYLRLRRLAAGKTLADVAAVIGTDPHVDERARIAMLERVEADELPIELPIAAAMRSVFRFDARVLVMLVPPLADPQPAICPACGCSWNDPCLEGGVGCHWTADGLCSSCSSEPRREAGAA